MLKLRLILAFGIVNAGLYAALLPLWEGFDEPFHCSYVETVWRTRSLPVMGRTGTAADIVDSFRYVPFGVVVHRWIPGSITFDEWFALSASEKAGRRAALDALRPGGDNSRPNYEAHHPPLAYLILAAVDFPMSRFSIRARVLALRLVGALSSMVLLFIGARSLSRTLELPEPFSCAAIFTIFCSQMLYATTAHVANDWLAVGISSMFFASLAAFVRDPNRKWPLALSLSLGLVTKAYFLAFAALAIIVAIGMIVRRRVRMTDLIPAAILVLVVAGPWYARNLRLYGNISGTMEEFDGIGFKQALAAAGRIDWLSTSRFLARGSLWMGNNSFTTYSRATLDVVLVLLAMAIVAWLASGKRIKKSEYAIFGGIVLYSIAIAYACCAATAHSKTDIPGASPWYAQVLLMPVLLLGYLGLSRSGRFGSAIAITTIALWTWVFLCTWTVKLFPMYSGAGSAPMRVRDAWNWYVNYAASHSGDLSSVGLAPAGVLYFGAAISLAIGIGLSLVLIRRMLA